MGVVAPRVLAPESPEQIPLTYRADLDGLRALAILLVVAFHARLPGLDGGFIGVDVFFTLSGYLISRLLIQEHNRLGRIDWVAFYARRIRRLLPSATLVLMTTLLAAHWLLLPDGERQRLAREAASAALFVSNFRFALQGEDYFLSGHSALQHTWSLGVEEQFYIGLPIAVTFALLLHRRGSLSKRKACLVLLVLGSLVSWLLAVLDAPGRAGYYLPWSRVYEFGLGIGVALLTTTVPRPQWRTEVQSCVGLLLIAWPAVHFHSLTPFPSGWALLPTAGTALLLHAGQNGGRGWVQRVLAWSPLRYVGRLSYAWYLWHWPVLVLADISLVSPITIKGRIALSLASFALAACTYHGIEQPIRRLDLRERRAARRTIASGALVSAFLAAVAMGVLWQANTEAEDPAFSAYLDQRHAYPGWSEHPDWKQRQYLRKKSGRLHQASFGTPSSEPALIFWGDSHIQHLHDGLANMAVRQQSTIWLRSHFGCAGAFPPPTERPEESWSDCETFHHQVIEEIRRTARNQPVRVVIGARWPKLDEIAREHFLSELSQTLLSLRTMGASVVLLGPLPEHPFLAPRCLYRFSASACQTPRPRDTSAFAHWVRSLRALSQEQSGVEFIDLAPAVCTGAWCASEMEGAPLYTDDNHLSTTGSEWVGLYLEKHLFAAEPHRSVSTPSEQRGGMHDGSESNAAPPSP